jgi:hypothetical protein
MPSFSNPCSPYLHCSFASYILCNSPTIHRQWHHEPITCTCLSLFVTFRKAYHPQYQFHNVFDATEHFSTYASLDMLILTGLRIFATATLYLALSSNWLVLLLPGNAKSNLVFPSAIQKLNLLLPGILVTWHYIFVAF